MEQELIQVQELQQEEVRTLPPVPNTVPQPQGTRNTGPTLHNQGTAGVSGKKNVSKAKKLKSQLNKARGKK